MVRRLMSCARVAAAAGAVLCLAVACASPPPPVDADLGVRRAASAAPDYVIGPGDHLNVFVYRAQELGAPNLPVRPDGRITLPLVPDIVAAGRTPTQLGRDIEDRLKQYVREPSVSVMVLSFIGPPSRQIRVIGEAAQPMALPYREGMSVLDVMIEAKGLTRYAAGNRAEIIRRDQPGAPAQVIRVRLSDLVRDGDISQDVALRPGDTLVIPRSWF